MSRRLDGKPDAATCQKILAAADALEKELQAMKDAGSTEHRQMALMGTKIDVDRAIATQGPLPWPVCCCGEVDVFGQKFKVVEDDDFSARLLQSIKTAWGKNKTAQLA